MEHELIGKDIINNGNDTCVNLQLVKIIWYTIISMVNL